MALLVCKDFHNVSDAKKKKFSPYNYNFLWFKKGNDTEIVPRNRLPREPCSRYLRSSSTQMSNSSQNSKYSSHQAQSQHVPHVVYPVRSPHVEQVVNPVLSTRVSQIANQVQSLHVPHVPHVPWNQVSWDNESWNYVPWDQVQLNHVPRDHAQRDCLPIDYVPRYAVHRDTIALDVLTAPRSVNSRRSQHALGKVNTKKKQTNKIPPGYCTTITTQCKSIGTLDNEMIHVSDSVM